MVKKSVKETATNQTTEKDILEAKKELARMRMSHALEPLKNPAAITQKKREVARAMTLLNQQVNSYGNQRKKH